MRILIAENDRQRSDDLIKILNELSPGSSAVTAEDLQSAVECSLHENFEAAFIDTGSDHKLCFEISSSLKKITPRLNIIFISDNNDFLPDAMYLHASGYILRPVDKEKVAGQLENLLFESSIKIICFGNFGITVNDRPVHFRRSKSMEVLAFLVDRRSACSRKQIAAAIFEDRSYDRSCQKYLDNIIRDLQEDLKTAGISELLMHENNLYSVNREICSCDYFDYIEYYRPTYKFHGEYMSQYSWSEVTLSILNSIDV